ncbi:MAG: methylene-tetrahydromethanopterin dehydrogenase N-terminal domain-containing protein [Planctomycetota bacterium]
MTEKILLQLDVDPLASTFDAVVAIDAGVDRLLTRAGVHAATAQGLVHGLMFTRGGPDLAHSAIFVGGGDVAAAERLFDAVKKSFFGPVRVSVMMDANGCNTTAAAAVVAAMRHGELSGAKAFVLGGTGPVGSRAARMLLGEGADVFLCSRQFSRAKETCKSIAEGLGGKSPSPVEITSPADAAKELQPADVLIACGAAGVPLLDKATLMALPNLKVAIDLNAVPPAGLEGVDATDKARQVSDQLSVYGALGVGGLKMRTHKAAITKLFQTNDQVLDAAEILALAKALDSSPK